MDLIGIVLALALIGLLVWVIQTYIPMPPMFKNVINIVVIIALVLWLLQRFGASIPNVL